MRHLAKHLAAPTAFVVAFLLGGAPSAPVADVFVQGCGMAYADDEGVVIDCWDKGGHYGEDVDQNQRDLYNSELCKTVREKDCWETAATVGSVGMAFGYAGGLLSLTGVASGIGAGLMGIALVLDAVAVGIGAACATQYG